MGSLQWKKVVCVEPKVPQSYDKCMGLPVLRWDGWMEVELGQFYSYDAANREVVIGFKETNNNNPKRGLIVAGIELRPII